MDSISMKVSKMLLRKRWILSFGWAMVALSIGLGVWLHMMPDERWSVYLFRVMVLSSAVGGVTWGIWLGNWLDPGVRAFEYLRGKRNGA